MHTVHVKSHNSSVVGTWFLLMGPQVQLGRLKQVLRWSGQIELMVSGRNISIHDHCLIQRPDPGHGITRVDVSRSRQPLQPVCGQCGKETLGEFLQVGLIFFRICAPFDRLPEQEILIRFRLRGGVRGGDHEREIAAIEADVVKLSVLRSLG